MGKGLTLAGKWLIQGIDIAAEPLNYTYEMTLTQEHPLAELGGDSSEGEFINTGTVTDASPEDLAAIEALHAECCALSAAAAGSGADFEWPPPGDYPDIVGSAIGVPGAGTLGSGSDGKADDTSDDAKLPPDAKLVVFKQSAAPELESTYRNCCRAVITGVDCESFRGLWYGGSGDNDPNPLQFSGRGVFLATRIYAAH